MALRHIESIHGPERAAHVYRDTEWQEYRVRFARDGKALGEAADYHTDDKGDALATAATFVQKGH